ncbi:MAG TPA: hypothetical protein VLF93_01315 [Candidatus Saccharimonadales bacterium]|nr:hypothetical protein [Candidatus Saccharimonadales bacterium]
MPEVQSAPKLSLSFAKLVATPTDITWSQAYNAGNLFVCISLTGSEETDEEISLQAFGKDLFNVLQSEFFTLQEKNTANIKKAIQTSLTQVPKNIQVGLTLAYFKDTILLVFIAGSGKVVMKRGEKIGTLLAKNGNDLEIISASGYMANADVVILETEQFGRSISHDIFTQALELELPNDIVEALSPQMHRAANGAQAAIVISCRGATFIPTVEEIDEDEDPMIASLHPTLPPLKESEMDDEPLSDSNPQLQNTYSQEQEYEEEQPAKRFSRPKLPMPHFNMRFNFNHRRRLFLNIALIIAILLIVSIFLTVKKYHDDQQQKTFQSIYPQAKQYYSEGKGLATVNASLSQNSFKKAQTILETGQTKFGKGTKEYQQITDLLSQVDSQLQSNSAGQSTNVTAIQAQPHSLLAVEQSKPDGLAYGEDKTDVYMITSSKITKVSKNDGTTTDIVKNASYWSSPVAIVPYDGNIYVLDQKKGLLKFVAGSGGYGKSLYFTSGGPDLSGATGMAIDASIWLLYRNGTIEDYTRGKSNNIQVSGLLKPLNNPTHLVTSITLENIYVLDSGNSRVVKFDKTGKYQSAYSAPSLATAKDFTVSETDKQIQFISGGKIWQMNL